MDATTRALKNTLRMEYPESKISVRIQRATNYVDSSDKILVYVSNATYADIKTTLAHCTHGMAIYPAGGVAAKSGVCAPQVWDAKTREFVDVDMCEFIEIKIDGADYSAPFFCKRKPAARAGCMHGYDTSGNFVSKIPCAYNRALFMTLNLLKISKIMFYFPFLHGMSLNVIMTEGLPNRQLVVLSVMVMMAVLRNSGFYFACSFGAFFVFGFEFDCSMHNTMLLQLFFYGLFQQIWITIGNYVHSGTMM